MADAKYYQAKREREAYMRAIPDEKRIGWATSSANARWHADEHCHATHGFAVLPVDETFVIGHAMRRCPFCNAATAVHDHEPDTCADCRGLWLAGAAYAWVDGQRQVHDS